MPQLADTAEVRRRTMHLPGFGPQILVPNARGVARAPEAGARHLIYVISASDVHNRSNVRRDTDVSIKECGETMLDLRPPDRDCDRIRGRGRAVRR